jgi:hypothetical protein
VLDPEKDCIAVTFAGPAVVTLLMDPNAPVNAWPRILPAKAITLPPEFVELARSQMELSIRVGPALLRRPWKAPAPGSVAPASAPPVSAPLPAPQGLAGKWFFRSPVAPDDLRVVAPETQATFDGALPLAAEGRLVLTTAPEPSTERSKEEVTQ